MCDGCDDDDEMSEEEERPPAEEEPPPRVPKRSALEMELAVEAATMAGIARGARAAMEELAPQIVELTVENMIMQVELEAERDAIATVTSAAITAEKALEARIETLQRQLAAAALGGGDGVVTSAPRASCWLDAVSQAKRGEAQARAHDEKNSAKLQQLTELQLIGSRLRAKGETLLQQLDSKKVATKACLLSELAAPTPTSAEELDIQEQQVRKLTAHLEQTLFHAGAGDVARTKYILDSLCKRRAVQLLMDKQDAKTARLQRAMTAMIESASGILGHLTTGKRGTRAREDHARFETIVAALVPDDAKELELINAIAELLGIHHEQIERALEHRRVANEDGTAGAFSRATAVTRKQRKDYRGAGRRVAIDYWHKATRLDTNVGKKKRHREVNPVTGEVFYREHWRHVQYDTDQQIADDFFKSVDYQQYLADGGRPFSKDLFLQCKCFCIEKSNFQECACPTCTLMRETLRGWHQQRSAWYRTADASSAAACPCGSCGQGSAYREASSSLGKLRAFVHAPCGKQSFPELAIQSGPKSSETVEFYRRQCCRAPLPAEACSHQRAGAKAKAPCKECADCELCGWAATMPACPIEHGDQADAEWKEYRPRVEPDGRSFQDELVTVKGTRKQLMERLQLLFAEWSPHDWIDRWAAHQRHLTYSTFGATEMCISTDFSAQYEHKAFCTRTCEHPARSNMDVFIVTHSPLIENGERVVTTDVWRIFSEAKGSALFHNQALDDIVNYYRTRLGLTRVYIFSDGCRSQYKGKKNFARIAQFPSRIHGVKLVHRFAASHHFKGPHDAYGKDAKLLCRTAERNGKARLASTHDVYCFCATMLPRPRREGITADEVVAPLPAAAPLERTLEEEAQEATAAAAALERAATDEARRRLAKRLSHAGLAPAPTADVTPPPTTGAATLAAEEAEAVAAAKAAAVAPDGAAIEAAAQEAGRQAVQTAEADATDEEEAVGDFRFDANGARIGAGHAAAEGSDEEGGTPSAAATTTTVGAGAGSEPAPKRQRAARRRRILTQAPGMEASADGAARVETEAPRRRGIFAASEYFWLYYAADGVKGLTKQVGINQGSGPHGTAARGEYHAILLDALDTDADSIAGSNSTYEFAGMHSDKPELLYTRTYSCACALCREPSSVAEEFAHCPVMSTVGRWRQQAIYSAVNVVAQRKVILEGIKQFLAKIKADKLYAAFASYREELGGRPYWLLKTKSEALTGKTLKVPGGTTIRKDQYYVEAQWYLSSYDTKGCKKYKLLEETFMCR